MLQSLQAHFQGYLLGRVSTEEMSKAIHEGRLTSKAVLLNVYFQAYRLRLIEALETEFPALVAAMGTDAFNNMADGYIQTHPSHHPSVRWFGRHLPDFLRQSPSWRENPQYGDIAAFEWALSLAFDAADATAADEADAAVIPPDAWPVLGMEFLPSLHRCTLSSNAPQMRQAVDQEAETLPELEQSNDPVAWVIWRPELTMEYRSMEIDEAKALDCAREGGNFSDICQTLLQWTEADSVAARAAGLLRAWLQQRMIARFIVPD